MQIAYHTALTADAQRALGITPAPLAYADRVHHDDLDTLNHVNNTRYFVWFERGRIALMAHYGIGTLNDPLSPRIVIRSGEVRFIKEVRMGRDYVITTRCAALRTTSMQIEQMLWVEGVVHATFTCVMVLLTPDGAARMPIPDSVRTRLIADGAEAEIAPS